MPKGRKLLGWSVALLSQLVWAAPASAQVATPSVSAEAPAPATPAKGMGEEITITGSRIRRKDLTAPAPVTIVNREQILASGKTTIGDFLQALPEQGNTLNTSVNNGGDGSTRISLRGLGANRTLVLLNGRRMVPGGNGADDSVDLSTIPSAAVERIEVLKDGASAIYGSDAIAGVVNIITRKRFNGAEVSVYGGTSQHGDGNTIDLSGTVGTAGERGGALFTARWYKQEAVMAGSRDYSKVARGFDGAAGEEYITGSATIPQGRIVLSKNEKGGADGTGNAAWQQLMAQCTKTDRTTCPSSYLKDPTTGAYREYTGADAYNFQPKNYLVTPNEQFQLFTLGDYELVPEYARAYYEASYSNRKSAYQLAEEPFITSSEGITVSKDNLYNPFGRDFADIRRRMVELGGRRVAQDVDSVRVVLGVDGTIKELNNWFWDLSFNYGRTNSTTTKEGNLFRPALANALGPSMLVNGTPTCVQKANDASTAIDGCVPLNLFGGAGTITPEMAANLSFTGIGRGYNQLYSIGLNTSGELFMIPTANRAVGLALGYEHRRVSGGYIPDPITGKGLTTGNKETQTEGSYYTNEIYGELNIPLVQAKPFVENLEVTAAARAFKYSNFGSDWTYKLGVRYSPIQDVTLRGTYSTAFRAPNVSELYLGRRDSFDGATDPCAPNGTVPPNCGTAANNGDTDTTQYRSTQGGNPNLKPETAKTFTAGVVVQPRMIKNLTMTVDYYNIKIEDTISTIGTSNIIASCYPTDGSAPKYCDLITRDARGFITNVLNVYQNVGKDETSGIDFALRYALPSDFGRFGFLVDGTWVNNYDRTLASGQVVHAAGTFDLSSGTITGGVFPKLKVNAGVNYGLAGFVAGVSGRYQSSIKECGDNTGDFSQGSGQCYVDATYSRETGNYVVFDAYVGYGFKTVAGNSQLTVGVNNLADTPPRFTYTGLNHYDGTLYDLMGRFFYARLTHRI